MPTTGLRPVQRGRGRGIYDNMKTAVETVFVGKNRLYNRRFLQDVQPLSRRSGRLHAGIGLGEGPVREPVGLVRERFFAPRLRFKNLTR